MNSTITLHNPPKHHLRLIETFLPHVKVSPIFEWKEVKLNRCHICCRKLHSLQEFANFISSSRNINMMEDYIVNLRSMLQGEFPSFKEIPDQLGILGYQSENSPTLLCKHCLFDLYDWLEIQLLSGNEEINALVCSIKEKEEEKEITI